MKTFQLLMLLVAFGANAQISQKEFDEQMTILGSNYGQEALSGLTSLEGKYPNDGKVIFLRGLYNLREGDSNAAMMQFSQAIKAAPDFAYAYGGRAQLFAEKGMMDKAIADISEAIKMEPTNLSLLNSRAGYYYQNKQFTEGLEDMKTKMKLNPADIMGYYDAATLSKAADPNSDADSFFNQAYGQKEIPKFHTDVMFGKFLLNQGRFAEALPKYDAALATNESDFGDEDFQDAAIVYYKNNNYPKAIDYYTKAIALMPQNVGYRTNLAAVYQDQGDWQKLKETSADALAINSEDMYANMYMAIALQKTGNEQEAAEYQAKAERISEQH